MLFLPYYCKIVLNFWVAFKKTFSTVLSISKKSQFPQSNNNNASVTKFRKCISYKTTQANKRNSGMTTYTL